MRGPVAVLAPIAKSHPFEERRCPVGPENDPLKIGRAVARLKPAQDNAIFDCKVLSRNHAVLFARDNEFFIKDTKSSNGTFVNNERLAVTGDESRPRQVFTGDIIQLGVEIVENTNKLAHGCIYAMVQLLDDEGKVIPNTNTSHTVAEHGAVEAGFASCHPANDGGSMLSSHQLFLLQQYVAEAVFRDKQHTRKIQELEELLEQTEDAVEASKKAVISEDRLLSRIETLEQQVAIYSKNSSSDKLKEDLVAALEEKNKFETLAKENIRRQQELRAEAELRLAEVDRSLVNMEEEISSYTKKNKDCEERLEAMVETYDELKRNHEMIIETVAVLERELNQAQHRLREAEARGDEAIVDREHDRQLPELARNLYNALDIQPELVQENTELLVRLRKALNERGIGQEESVPNDPPKAENGLITDEISDNADDKDALHSLRELELQTQIEQINLQLEDALKENLQKNMVVSELHDEVAALKEENARLAEERRLSLSQTTPPTTVSVTTSVNSDADAPTIAKSEPLISLILLISLVPVFMLLLIPACVYPLACKWLTKKQD